MLKNILAGITGNQAQGQQLPQMPMMQMPQMMMPQQLQFDPYGQQTSGLKAALMGRIMNGFRL